MRADLQAQLAHLEERHHRVGETKARLLLRLQENEAQNFLRERAQGATAPAVLLSGRPDVRVLEFLSLDEDPEKQATLPGLTLCTSLHFQACDQKLLFFEEISSFSCMHTHCSTHLNNFAPPALGF